MAQTAQVHRSIEERIKWDTRKNTLEPDKEKFVTRFFAEDAPRLSPDLTGEQQTTVVQRLDTAWESLFYLLSRFRGSDERPAYPRPTPRKPKGHK
ncbi:MAG: hypothetical protein ACYC05_09560 [Sulfuricella sp.]